MTVKIHAIQTGTVQIKANQARRKESAWPAVANILFGNEWTDWLPILAWVIEHPQGLYVVDTGETGRTSQPGYLPRFHPYYRLAVRFQVRAEDEIGPQMHSLGLEPQAVTAVIMTHLHTDHAGGLYHFPQSKILLHPAEYRAAMGFSGKLNGYLPHRWPHWLEPTAIEFTSASFGPFSESVAVTEDGRLIIVPTPGHTAAHVSVIVRTDDVNYFLAGDTSYDQHLMVQGIPDGVATRAATETLARIRQFAADSPVVYLPSHDPEAADRLRNRQTVPPDTPATVK